MAKIMLLVLEYKNFILIELAFATVLVYSLVLESKLAWPEKKIDHHLFLKEGIDVERRAPKLEKYSQSPRIVFQQRAHTLSLFMSA